MGNVEAAEFMFRAARAGGRAAKAGGGFVKTLLGKVNPDVYRELAFVSMCSYSLLIPRREQIADKGADPYVPLVLVHGLGGNRGTFQLMRSFLRLNGHKRVYSFGYEQGDVYAHGESLTRFVDEVCWVTGQPKVDIVAHSLGGIISRYAIQRKGLADSVRNFITLATPHLGTYAAQYCNTTITVSLRPDSPLIKDLNSESLTCYPMKFTAVHSNRDVYVVPHHCMTHPDANNVFVPNISHCQFLLSPKIFRVVCDLLPPEKQPDYL